MEYPKEIRVSGLPLRWRGCNGVYKLRQKTEEQIDYVYELPGHDYLFMSIKPMIIRNSHDKWILTTDDYMCHIAAKSYDLLGEWDNCLVTENSSYKTWWVSNKTYILPFIQLIIILFPIVYDNLP